ncbi:MAG TPA: fumarylacetoacetate hydrolase family protein [Streptosporangiaceae bacterium]|nr:fumarylacetoacetate hydrolase family protein [Streptosporangiaceae bacterium]
MDDAYCIQREVRRLALADGAVLVGHKIGATSEAIRAMFKIDQPDSGFLTDRMVYPSGAAIETGQLISPKVEVELAFRIGAELSGDAVTAADVLACTSQVVPVLELLDSRIGNWAIRLVDTVADNASCAAVVCGDGVALDGHDLLAERVVFEVDGHTQAADGRAVIDGPAGSVACLVRLLSRRGESLPTGDLVLAGAWVGAVDVSAGSTAHARFENFGAVSLRMV